MYLQTANWAAQFDSVQIGLEILDSAIARFGPSDQFVVNKALFLSYLGRHRRAEALLRPIVERDDPPRPNMQLNLARVLASQPERPKKEEALSLYREIQPLLAGDFPIDSIIQRLENDLNKKN
jgi:hypothetical protein